MLGKIRHDLVGKRFGILTVIEYKYTKESRSLWLVRCDCGNEKIVMRQCLVVGDTKSCGCSKAKFQRLSRDSHGMSHTRFYKTWGRIIQRCTNPKHHKYIRYGKRGIKVCKKWLKFEDFRNDMYESYLGHVEKFGEKQTTIDRIDNNGDYFKENCRWATCKEQSRNTSVTIFYELDNKRQSLSAWADELGINEATLYGRVERSGWSVQKALTTPVRNHNK